MAMPLQTFVQQLKESGIVPGDVLDGFLPPSAEPADAEALARALVREKHLTRFQAERVARGESRALQLGNYVILDRIGAGGMGQVFKARHQRMDRTVAIKLLPRKLMSNPAAIARFDREVRAAARLNHPNIVTAYDADQAGDVYYLVMELVEGPNLETLIQRQGPLPVGKAVDCILQASRGLEAAHRMGIIHRDIKPANLLLDRSGVVKVLDMGLARLDEGDAGAAGLTSTGVIMGTVDYMAPEQAMDTRSADRRSDIYALGCSFHYLLTGKPMFSGDTMMKRLLAHREQPVPALRATLPDIPPGVDAIFRRMVAKEAADRYQTVGEVIADLKSLRTGDPITATSMPPPESPAANGDDFDVFSQLVSAAAGSRATGSSASFSSISRQLRRHPAMMFAAVAFVGLLLLAVVAIALSGGGTRP
jgi:serine/threonine protein kinase